MAGPLPLFWPGLTTIWTWHNNKKNKFWPGTTTTITSFTWHNNNKFWLGTTTTIYDLAQQQQQQVLTWHNPPLWTGSFHAGLGRPQLSRVWFLINLKSTKWIANNHNRYMTDWKSTKRDSKRTQPLSYAFLIISIITTWPQLSRDWYLINWKLTKRIR